MNTIEWLPNPHYWYTMPYHMVAYCGYSSGKMSINRASRIFRLASWANISGAWSLTSMNKELAAFIGRYPRHVPKTASWTIITQFIVKAATQCVSFLAYRIGQTSYTEGNCHTQFRFTMTQDQKLLMLCWHSYGTSGMECVVFSLAYNDVLYYEYV